MINILYKGNILYENLSLEESQEILLEIAEKFYDENLDINEIKIEYKSWKKKLIPGPKIQDRVKVKTQSSPHQVEIELKKHIEAKVKQHYTINNYGKTIRSR